MGKVTEKIMTMNQNAISMLNEMQQAGKIASFKFDEKGMTGSSHEPIFTIMVTVVRRGQTFKAEAEASNKKAAKQIAAAAVLQKLGIDVDVEDQVSTSEYSSEKTAVSMLNEYAQQYGGQPVYTDDSRRGPDHAPTFTMKVAYRGKTASGSGSSKKAAKEQAAKKLMGML